MDCKEFFDNAAAGWDEKKHYNEAELIPYISLANINSGEKVLDLGCGTGITSKIIYSLNADVTALDLSSEMIKIAKKKYAEYPILFLEGDFYNISLPQFDKIVIFNAYPHFLDKELFKNKLYDILKVGGTFSIIHNMSKESLSNIHKGNMDISRELLSAEKEAEFYKDKFKLLNVKDTNNLYFIQAQKKL